MHAHHLHFLVGECSGLVQERDGDKCLADVVQKRSARQTALIVLAHPEMLREGDGETGHEQAVTVAIGVMAADGVQPFTQRSLLDGAKNLVLDLQDVAEPQRRPRRQLVEYLGHQGLGRGNAAVQRLAAGGRVENDGVRKRGPDALQNVFRIERPGDRIGGAQRPGLHRSVVKRVRQNEQPRHGAVRVAAQLVAHLLHALRRAQIDVDHDPRNGIGGRLGNFRGRDGIDVTHGLQDAGQFAALVGAVRGKQQAAFGRSLGSYGCHKFSTMAKGWRCSPAAEVRRQ